MKESQIILTFESKKAAQVFFDDEGNYPNGLIRIGRVQPEIGVREWLGLPQDSGGNLWSEKNCTACDNKDDCDLISFQQNGGRFCRNFGKCI